MLFTQPSPDEDSIPPPSAVVTPMALRVQDHDPGSPDSPLDYDRNRKALEHARWDAEQSANALEYIVSGIRAVKRILERRTYDENDHLDTLTDDIQLVHELSEKLHGVLGSDLLALVNAADMIREHSKLAFQEASDLVIDVNQATLQAQEADIQARQARKIGRALYKENLELKCQVEKLRHEKRLLVKEVKTLREEAAETRKFDSWRLLEQHVLGSMAIHEMMIKSPAMPRHNVLVEARGLGEIRLANDAEPKSSSGLNSAFEQYLFTPKREKVRDRTKECAEGSASKATGFGSGFANIRGVFRSRRIGSPRESNDIGQSEQEDTPCKEEAFCEETKEPATRDIGSSSKVRAKSPMPSLGEVSSYTNDSATKTPRFDAASVDYDHDKNSKQESRKEFPKDVAFDTTRDDWRSPCRLPSPLMFSDGSPDGVVIPAHKPICDPNILRTLAIPSNEQRTVELKKASPRKRVTDSLHEC